MVGSWNDATVRIRRDFRFQVAGHPLDEKLTCPP